MINSENLLKLSNELRSIPHLDLTNYLPQIPLQQIIEEIQQFTDNDFQPYVNDLVRLDYLDNIQKNWRGLCLVEYCKEGKHHIDYKTVVNHNLTFYEDGECYPTDIGICLPKTMEYLYTIAKKPDRTRLLRLYPGGDATWHSHYNLGKSGIGVIENQLIVDPVIQIPLITNDRVRMLVSKDDPRKNRSARRYVQKYNPGQIWIFNSYHFHNTVNDGLTARDHIMMYVKLNDEFLFPVLERAVSEYKGVRI